MTRKTLTVYGSHGELIVDAMTGIVLFYDPCGDSWQADGYTDFYRLDLQEWRGYWGEELPALVDVLDFAGYTFDGIRFTACMDWREGCADALSLAFRAYAAARADEAREDAERVAAALKQYRELSPKQRRTDRPAWGSQEWAETHGDDLGESPDY